MTDTITICFYGSSDHELEVKLADFFENDVDLIVDSILKVKYSKIKIITGGYGGIMNSIAEKFANKRNETEKNIEIIGITCDAYDFEVPFTDNYNDSNDYSVYNNVIIQSQNFTERIQAMAELSDVFIVLPGKQGTLSEFLITCESYSFGHYILNGKNTKILIHEYWRPLLNSLSPTNDSYFRKFNNDILRYFDEKNFESHICDLLSASESPKNLNVSITLPLSDYWERIILELKCNICSVILGRLFHENGLLLRLKRSNEDPILGLDFGWFHTYNSIGRDGAYYSYSRKEYLEKTKKFFQAHNSIMLSTFMKDFDYEYINGTLQDQSALDFHTDKFIPEYNSHKYKSDFSKLSNFFNQENYGQTLIWKGFKTKLGDEISNTIEESDTDILIFSVFLLLNHKIPKTTIERINQLLSDFLLKASATKSGELFKEKDKDIINQATRAAISQVMARNTSHNIGAHVMNKLTNADFLQNFCSYSNCLKSYKPDKDFEGSNSENHKPFNQLAIFNNYVKCRMDYLADISFGTPLMQTNKYVYGDLFMELDKVRLLLEHISGLDNFKFKIEFKRNGKDFAKDEKGNILNDLLVAIPNDILGTQAFYNILENIIRNTAKHSNKETLGDKPVVVFTINFIDDIEESEEHNQAINRNEIENVLTEFIAVEVYDNIPVVGDERELTPEEKKEYRDKMKKDLEMFATKIDALIFNQNSKLNDDILQKDNKIRSYSLGLVEMDASAAYLRKRPVEYINHKSYDIHYDEWWSRDTEVNEGDQAKRGTNCRHFLKAFKKTEGDKNYLGYRFFLHRPAVVLVVTNELENDKEKKDKLQKDGIWVITPQKFEQDLISGKAYPHEFVMHTDLKGYKTKIKNNEKEEEVEILKYFKTSLPVRVLEVTKDQLNNLFNTQEGTAEIQSDDKKIIVKKKILDNWVEFCWLEWEKQLKSKYGYSQYGTTGLPKVSNKIALITDHLKPKEGKSIETTWNSLKEDNNAYYIEPTSTKAQSYLPQFSTVLNNHYRNNPLADVNNPLDNYLTELKNNYVVHKIKVAESILTQITVIDERIQEANKPIPIGIAQHEIYHWMRIYEPEKDIINLSSNTIDDNLKNKIESYIQGRLKDSDFLLIHYSILERIHHSKTGKEKLKAINDDLLRYAGNTNVVVTSGRGVPDKLPSEVRFINLSSVIMAFNEVRGKFLINYLLNSSRKSNHV